jgi:FKBP-type peptidyl-prolyl cis-trans isomerase FklB
MKKIALLALALVVSAAFMTASADKKKSKKKDKAAAVATVETPVPILSSGDTLSYALGYAAADGLLEYIERQFQVGADQIGTFTEVFKETLGKSSEPSFKARQAALTIASLFEQRILPEVTETFAGTGDSINANIFTQAFLAAVKKDTTVMNMPAATDISKARSQAVKEQKDEAYRIHNLQWLVNNREQEGVVTTESGLQYKVITKGTGPVPTESDKVTVKYEGRLIDGTVFDSSYKRNPQTTTFRVNQVIRGWTEALTMMPVGSKWELYIPQELAYGSRQTGKEIKPYSTLIFVVELVDIVKD